MARPSITFFSYYHVTYPDGFSVVIPENSQPHQVRAVLEVVDVYHRQAVEVDRP